MSSLQSSAVPAEINTFFTDVYHQSPSVEEGRKCTVYSTSAGHMAIATDSYGGCHVTVPAATTAHEAAAAQTALTQLADALSQTRAFDSLWIDMHKPVSGAVMGTLVAPFSIGTPGKCDLIIDDQQNMLRVWTWLNEQKECAIPAGATHNIGATGIIVDRTANKILLVVNQRRNKDWNLPGGSYEPDKDRSPEHTALREAQEEGGFALAADRIQSVKLVGQLQFPKNQFAPAINQTWAFFAGGVSATPLNPPANEIKLAKWVDIQAVLEADGELEGYKINKGVQKTVAAVAQGFGWTNVLDKGWMVVHTESTEK